MYFNYYLNSNHTGKQLHFRIVLSLQLDVLVESKVLKITVQIFKSNFKNQSYF